MAKPKCSTYLPHILSAFSSVFIWIFQVSKIQTVSITGRRMFASTLGTARLFTPMNSSCAKINESVARLLRQPIQGFGCVAHKRIYSQWLPRYMMPSVFFVATPKRNATATRKEPLWWDGFYSDSLKQMVDQLWEHCASCSYTRRRLKLILERWSVLEAETKTYNQHHNLKPSHFHDETDCSNMAGDAVKLATVKADMQCLGQQARSKRLNKTRTASALSTTESEASWEEDSRSSQTWVTKCKWNQVKRAWASKQPKQIISCLLISATKAFGHLLLLLPPTVLRTPVATHWPTVCTRKVKLTKAPWNCRWRSWMPGWSVLPSSRWPEWCNDSKVSPNLARVPSKNRLNSLMHFRALGFFEAIYLVDKKSEQSQRKDCKLLRYPVNKSSGKSSTVNESKNMQTAN